MGNIIVILVPDPDGKIFEEIVNVVNSETTQPSHADHSKLVFPGLSIDMDTGIVIHNGISIPLTNSEFRILCHMAQSPGRIFTKDQLYTAVFGEQAYNTNTVPTVIWRLRKKLGRNPLFIKTVVGLGYKFEPPNE